MLAVIENPVLWWTAWGIMTATFALLCNIMIMECSFYKLRTATYVIRGAVMGASVVAFLWLLSGCTSASAQCVPASNPACDVNSDGVCDAGDLLVIRSGKNWGRSVECSPTVNDPLIISVGLDRAVVTLAIPHKTYKLDVPSSQVIRGLTLIGTGKGTAINVRKDTLIIDCTIRNWQTGVGSGDPNVKVWIVNSTISDCTDYGAYLPGTGVAVIGSTISRVGGTCLRLPHYRDAVVYDTTIESSSRRLLLKAHNATRLGKPYSSGLWVEKCKFVGSDTQDYLVTVAPQNRTMTEDVRNATFVDCDFVFGKKTKIGLLLGGTGMRVERCRFDARKGVPTRWAIVGERQGSSPYALPVVADSTVKGAVLER